jgi:hypothetical protein
MDEFKEFARLAEEKFGDKVSSKPIKVDDEAISEMNEKMGLNVTKKDFEEYNQKGNVWLLENKCPNCEVDLLGIFGSFQWGTQHGIGSCSHCNEVEFQYYHYIGDSKTPLKILSVCGF